jgi:hypothetical protein
MGRNARGFTRAGSMRRERRRAPKLFRSSGEAVVWDRTNESRRVGPLPSERELQREESNLRDDRLTAGCLTIRLRWKNSARRVAWSNVPRVRGRASCAKFSESEGAGARDRAKPWFRAQDSNLCFWIQRPASCQLDDPGVSRGQRGGRKTQRARGTTTRARRKQTVGREGLAPSSLGLKARCSAD